MKLSKCIILLIFISAGCSELKSQNSFIPCWKAAAQLSKMLEKRDTTTALILFEKMLSNECPVNRFQYLKISSITFETGNREVSRKYFKKAIEKGLISAVYFEQSFDKLLEEGKEKYGENFMNRMKYINDSLTTLHIEDRGDLIRQLKKIYDEDQRLRKDKHIKECKSYAFRLRLGFLEENAENHAELMNCNADFREKDSILLAQFISIIDSLGYVPNDETVFGMLPINPIINHTAHFNYKGLREKLLDSVIKGKLSPRIYAWWVGYHKEYFKKSPEYFYVKNRKYFDNLSVDEINKINENRRKIGLDDCPKVIWGSSSF